MRVVLTLAVLALVALSYAQAGLIYQRTTVPKGWQMLGAADPTAPVSFSIGLNTRNDEALEALFWTVSDPDSPDYLKFLTSEQVEAQFGASEDDRVAVQLWLLQNGVTQMTAVSSAIGVTTTAAVAARLFNTEMRSFVHLDSGKRAVKAWGAYSLPEDIHLRVELVTGISSFPVPGRSSPFKAPKNGVIPPDMQETIVPQSLVAMYNIRKQKPASAPKVTQSVIEYENQFFSNNDTQLYAYSVGYNTSSTKIAAIPQSHVIGTNDPTSPQVESSLDVQMMQAVNLEVSTWFWIEDGSGWLYEFGTHLLNNTARPEVQSTSYGWWEGDQCAIDDAECQQLGVDSYGYTAAVNKLFQKVGVVGVSLVVASGDSGAHGRTDGDCTAAQLRPEFPASSPYVTTVGATEVRNATYLNLTVPACQEYACINMGVEMAVSVEYSYFTSGGGFSNVSGANRPMYQDSVVADYLNSGIQLPNASMFNYWGRGEPDVSAVGHNGFIIVGGSSMLVGGTSMSSPIFAAIMSLLTEIAIAKTGSPLGFLNPLLYKMAASDPSTFNDVTEGDNICTEDGCSATCQGFIATEGWDPVTGLGTPNAAAMEAYVSSLMDRVVARRLTATQ